MQSSSTTSLLTSSTSSSSIYTPKKWEESFGTLVSSYGFGPLPSLPSKSTNDKTRTSTPLPNRSETTLAPKSQKDFEAAFGALSSSYGFAGGVPSLPSKIPKKAKPSTSSSTSTVPNKHPTMKTSISYPKDYQSAFGDLSLAHGFGGASSSWGTKK